MTKKLDENTHWLQLRGDDSDRYLIATHQGLLLIEELPVSEPLKNRIEDWHRRYNFDDHRPPADRDPFDAESYAIEGLTIARDLKRELPHWTINYWDLRLFTRWGDNPAKSFYDVDL